MVRETGLTFRVLPEPAPSKYKELHCTDGKLLLSFSLDSSPSSGKVLMGCCGQLCVHGVVRGVAHDREALTGAWRL